MLSSVTSFKLASKDLKFPSNSRHVEILGSGVLVDSLCLFLLPDIAVVVDELSKALTMLSTADEAEEAATLLWFSSTISLLASSIFFFDVVI